MAPTSDPQDQSRSVSDPSSPGYDPHSPFYDVTSDSSSQYYVGPLATASSQSGDTIRAEAVAEVERQLAGKTWASDAVHRSTEDKMVQALYQQKIAEARNSLDHGVELRSPGSPPTTDWSNATHEQMQAAISQNADSATVAESSEEWVSVGNELAQHQANLADAISSSTSDWQGEGGDAARQHLANVGKWLGQTAQGATLTGRQQEIHSQALNETQRWMAANPPVKFSVQEANAVLQTVKDPHVYAVLAEADQVVYKVQQASRAQAAAVMTNYDRTVGTAVATPAFAPPPKLPSSTSFTGSTPRGTMSPLLRGTPMKPGTPANTTPLREDPLTATNGPGGGPGGTGGGPSGGPGTPGGINDPGGQGGSPFGGGPGSSGGPGSVPPLDTGGPGSSGSPFGSSGPGGPGGGMPPISPISGDTTHISGYTPPPPSGGNPSFAPPPIPGIGPNTGAPFTGGPGPGSPGFTPPPIPDSFPPGSSPFGPGGTGGPGGVGGTGPGGASPGGAGKIPTIGNSGGVNGSSIASRLGGAGGGLGGGASGGSGSGSGSNLSGGNASGAAAAEAEAAGRPGMGGAGAAGAAGKSGGPMGSPMGGAGGGKGGKGEDDKEYRLADYLEPEDDSLFAADEVVAPPVIGDWKNKDWK